MGQATNALLVYGYHLDGQGTWNIEEVDKYGALALPWWTEDADDEERDFEDVAMVRLLASIGFTETDWQVDGFYGRRREAEAKLGVTFVEHCSMSSPMLLLSARTITVHRGDVRHIDASALTTSQPEYDAKLAHALEVLQITPKQQEPAWLLCSWWEV